MTAVEYGIVLTLIGTSTLPAVYWMNDGAEDELGHTSDKIGQLTYDNVDEVGPFAPSGGPNFDAVTLLDGDDLTPGGLLSSDTTVYGAFESGPVVLGADLSVEGTPAGTYTITAGTTVCATLIHVNPQAGSVTYTADVDFPGPILGWIDTTTGLNNSDAEWGNPGVVYNQESSRGFEWDTETLTVVDSDTLQLGMTVSAGHTDEIRVFYDCSAV